MDADRPAGAVFAVGALADGRRVDGVRLAAEGVEAQVWTYGAALASLRVAARDGWIETLPNPDGLAALEADRSYHARVIGRVANRIDGAAFTLDGRRYALEANEGPNTLHGGPAGWSGRLWRFTDADPGACTLAYRSPEGEGGFPGAVEARVDFRLGPGPSLTITWAAEVDAPTPLAMTHHLYFNLSGRPGGAVLGHTLRIAAGAVTAVDAALLPTGESTPVAGTALDLNRPRALGAFADPAAHPLLGPGGGLDLNYVLDRGEDAVTLACPDSGLSLHVSTDQPGCQVYGGQGLAPPLARYGGVALEPQAIPDAVNRPQFPSVVVRPGAAYRRFARYRFEAGGAA